MKRKSITETTEVPNDVQKKKKKQMQKKVLTAEEREKQKTSLYRLPTADELNELKENENLYKNNLFKMQLDYLLEEVCMNENKMKKITKVLQSLEEFLKNVHEQGESHSLSSSECIAHDITFPLPSVFEKQTMKGKFQFFPPEEVKVTGSYFLKTITKPNKYIDIVVEIPKKCFQRHDNLNFKYLYKRAYYLTWLASALQQWEYKKDIKFSYVSNRMKPHLLVTLTGKVGNTYSIRLFTAIPSGIFKATRFGPLKNNIRANWYDCLDDDTAESFAFPTPFYNCSILSDMLYEDHLQLIHQSLTSCPSMKDAICLFKVWLEQRSFDGVVSFNGFICSMLMSYMLSTKYISPHMSSYQIFRLLLSFLATSDLTTKGISLCQNQSAKVPLSDFHNCFDVVFVDQTGYLNLMADVDKITYKMITSQAKRSIEMLDDVSVNSFECLFIKKHHFLQTVDHSFSLKSMNGWKKKITDKPEQKFVLIDRCGDWTKFLSNKVFDVLNKGLDNRMTFLIKQPCKRKEWPICSQPSDISNDIFTFGIGLNTETYDQMLIMGPSAEKNEAKEFREFWGSRSELRRFQDGNINEAVIFKCHNEAEKRMISKDIVYHLLDLHCGLNASSITYHGSEADEFLRPRYFREAGVSANKAKLHEGCGEEEIRHFSKTYETLVKEIRNLDDLPLRINVIQGIDAIFRNTEVILPRQYQSNLTGHSDDYLVPNGDSERVPTYSPAHQIIVQFETSGKWPDDITAIQHIKTAFQIKLANCIKKSLKIPTVATSKWTDVIKNGYLFRLTVVHYREMLLFKESLDTTMVTSALLKKQFDTRAKELDLIIVKKSTHTTLINSLSTRFIAYGPTVRICKRWLACQLLSGYFNEETVELLVAHFFLNPAPSETPSCHLAGFLRFLNLLIKHDWTNESIIVDFNAEITANEMHDISEQFAINRSRLPALHIVTSYDRETSVWTKANPTAQILRRASLLAHASLQLINNEVTSSHLKQLFRPSFDEYDVIIKLNPSYVPLHHYAIDSIHAIKTCAPKENVRNTVLPIVDFDPVRLYYNELQEAFGEIAMFFYDQYGGLNIAVVWKTTAFTKEPFRIMNAKFRTLVEQKKSKKSRKSDSSSMQALTKVNLRAVISDFQIIGEGIVKDVVVNNLEKKHL